MCTQSNLTVWMRRPLRLLLALLLRASALSLARIPDGALAAPTIDPDTYDTVSARHSGKLLDVAGRSTADGGSVLQWASNGGTNQQWRLVGR